VHGFHLDGFAQEKINLPARLLVAAPPGVDAIGAAVAPVTFGTVEHMLFDNAKLEPGETILSMPAAPASARPRSSLPSRMGCTVITTVGSNDKIEKAKALGADHVINYREDRFEGVVRKLTKKKGVDVVFEHVGKDTWAGSMLCLKRGGRLVTCGSTSGVSTDDEPDDALPAAAEALGSFGCRMENMADAMQKMAATCAAGGVVPPPCIRSSTRKSTFDGIDDGAGAHGRPRTCSARSSCAG
jgi:alcohol dehydrogenase